ncbi:hypothetical protein [Litorivivens sp.]|uniref:hypothetical protein n=1 Tax=Litorivivens sp. TaxID=2020868 RepID=UPI00356188EB
MPTTYCCQDCSYQGHNFRQGRCPACGSANISRRNKSDTEKPRGPLSLIICIALWIILGATLIRRFF